MPILVVAIYFYLNLFANALTDDAFITLRYVKTLLHTGTWGFVPGYITNAVTSPLNIFLLAFAGTFLGATINAVIWLSAIILALTALLLADISFHLFRTRVFGYLAACALIFNPLIVSTLGLESILFVGLYIVSAYLYLTKRWAWLAVALGLLTITRFDGIVFFVVTLLLVPTFRLRAQFTVMYLLSIAPWYIFSWIYLGSVFPDTFFIKTAQHSWGNWDFLNGINLYFRVYKLETIFSFLLLPLLLLLFNREARNSTLIGFLLLTGIAHFAGYSILHVPPYYWYYVPETTAIILASSIGLGILFQQRSLETWTRKGIQGIAAIILVLQVSGMFYIINRDGFPIREMPIHTNWATHGQYKQIGEWLKEHNEGSVIVVDGEIGTLGYYCDCYLSSFFSDRKWLGQYVRSQTTGDGIKPALYRINFLFLDKEAMFPQPAYLLSESPGEKNASIEGIKDWRTKTKWISSCLIKLSRYSQ
ncbi:MAG TPA: hypothetical protein VFZ43_13330 [Anaerolineales bacterium]